MHDCRIVLVRPHFPGNLGATARVMHNFGLTRLVLVAPLANPADREARRLATHGEFILDRAQIVPTLADAVADCVFVAATSARTTGIVRETSTGTLRQVMPAIASAMQRGPVAIVFGPEPNGLTTAEVGLCHGLMHISANVAYPVLNLAQAVAICLYEWHQYSAIPSELPREAEPSVSFAELEPMYRHLRKGLEEIHFLYGAKADSLMHALRHLIGRAAPTEAEVKLLHGLARQLEWVARNRPPGFPHATNEAAHLDTASPTGL